MIPVMTGVLLASRMKKENRVAVAYFGEGASFDGRVSRRRKFRRRAEIAADYNYRK